MTVSALALNSPAGHFLVNGTKKKSILVNTTTFLAAGSHMELSFSLVDMELVDQVQCSRTEAAPLSALQGNLP